MARGKRPADLRAASVTVNGKPYLLLSYPRGVRGADALTAAERDVALALLAGYSNAEIAQMRGSATRTVANQVATIFRKLGVSSRAELAAVSFSAES